MKYFLAILFITLSIGANSQGTWVVSELASMPEPVTNNAVAGAMLNGEFHIYSFMGLDSTKLWSGIHNRSFRYNTATDFWDTIPQVPDILTRIAGSASTVKNKIYIIGGYHVYQSGNEISSKNIFIYNPDLPIPTDDHVQCVWRDSLIYIITGWSNTGNIPNVQIYDPTNDTVLSGTPIPNSDDYKAFGASGVIIGDTIYYAGGVNDSWIFTIQPRLRKGIINPNQPDSITWSFSSDSAVNIYRSAAAVFNNNPIWIGGGASAYNYDGLEYGTNSGVDPLDNIVQYQRSSGLFSVDTSIGLSIMDLRGVVQMGNQYLIAGGMDTGQVISDKLYWIEYIITPAISESGQSLADIHLFPNPTTTTFEIVAPGLGEDSRWCIYSAVGELMRVGRVNNGSSMIDTEHYASGIYLLRVDTEGGIAEIKFIVAK
ncbi:MAG TPA: T9SS C-terminal target domain-containing protein [Flavobacteriales bacterium]|nr:T9SS C-terminal target domain-containing protein [Flavobacteriales bacterium]